MSKSPLNKEKYLEILKKEGLSAALTQLHQEAAQLEYSSFEGQEGWQPELYKQLDEYREFSRELWDTLSK